MIERDCPSELELAAQLENAEPSIAAHVAGCAACRAIWQSNVDAIALARQLPVDVPSETHREEVRTALLAASRPRQNPRRHRRWYPAVVLVAAAAAMIAVVAAVQRPTSTHQIVHARRGAIHPHAAARFAFAADPPDEIVRLRDGVLDVDVQPLQRGERFRVIVGADEVEVHGTSFQVTAHGDELVAVQVVHGRVEVRRHGQPSLFLTAGESWALPTKIVVPERAEPTAPVALVPSPTPHVAISSNVKRATVPDATAATTTATVITPPPATAPIQESAFVAGWEAMRRGEFRSASTAFARALALDPNGALAEDAAFWNAVALARGGRKAEAKTALRDFIDNFALSTRAGEASAMLGWLLVENNELEEAREHFRAALSDPSATVQRSAREGLAAVGH